MTKLVDLLLDSGSDLQREDRLLIDSALGLWAQLAKGETAKGKKPEIDKKFVLRGLIEANTLSVRDSFYTNYREIAKESDQVAEQLFNVLFEQLKNLEDLGEFKNKKGRRTMEYFSLMSSLIPLISKSNPTLLHEIVSVCITCSKVHNSTEASGDFYVDSTRVGLFKMISVILDLFRKDNENKKKTLQIISDMKLIDHVHHECLFYYGSASSELEQNND